MANCCDFRRYSRAFADVMPWRSMLGSAAADIAKNVGNPLEVAYKNHGTASKMVSFHELSGNMMVIEWYWYTVCMYVYIYMLTYLGMQLGLLNAIYGYWWVELCWIPWDSNKLPNAEGNSPCFGCFNQICMRWISIIVILHEFPLTSWVSSVGYNLPGMAIFWVIVVFHLSCFFWMFVFLLFCFYLLLCCSASLLRGLSAYLLFLVFFLPLKPNKHQETLYVNSPWRNPKRTPKQVEQL